MDELRLLQLLEKYIEGSLDDAERAELERRIVDSPEARRSFWEYLEQHASILELRGEARGRALAGLEKPPTRRRRAATQQNGWLAPLLIAAAVLFGLVVIFAGSRTDPPPPRAPMARKVDPPPAPEKVVVPTPPEPEKPKDIPVPPVEPKPRIDEEPKPVVVPPVVVTPKLEEPKPAPAPEKTTVALAPAVARVVKAEGGASVKGGQDLVAGQGFEGGAVEVLYPDQTRIAFTGAAIREFGMRFAMDRGELHAVVMKQPKNQPMVIDTPTGEVTVLGTTLRLKVDTGTRLEVEEGVVSLKSKLTGKTVTVESGHYAVSAAGVELKALPIPIDEILLTAAHAKLTGKEWRIAGSALETVAVFRGPNEAVQSPSFATLTFEANAGKDYYVWVRGVCTGTVDRDRQDRLVLRFSRAQATQLASPDVAAPPPDTVLYGGWANFAGPRWIGGDGDYFLQGKFRVEATKPGARVGDEMPVMVSFVRPGTQTLRIQVAEGPMKIEAIWLSTTQKTRPAPGQTGPAKR